MKGVAINQNLTKTKNFSTSFLFIWVNFPSIEALITPTKNSYKNIITAQMSAKE